MIYDTHPCQCEGDKLPQLQHEAGLHHPGIVVLYTTAKHRVTATITVYSTTHAQAKRLQHSVVHNHLVCPRVGYGQSQAAVHHHKHYRLSII